MPITLTTIEEGKSLDVNHEFVQQSGFSCEELIGRTVSDINLWANEADRQRLVQQFQTQGYVHGFETHFQIKSGQIIDVRLFLEPIQITSKTYLLMTGENITQPKLNEKKLSAKTQALSEALETLKATQADLIRSAKMAALGNMVAGVAHEINTPVGTALMSASTLQNATQKITGDLTTGEMKRSSFESYLSIAAECSQLILENLQRTGNLVTSFKQVAVDQSSLSVREFNLNHYLKDVINSLSPRLKHTSHQIHLTGDDTIILNSYPGTIAQIITNLILNSITHAYPAAQSGTLTIHLQKQDDSFTLTYRDNGCGIAPERQPHIFEPFFTTARNRGSSGLGLHLVYNLVTQTLKGSIELAKSSHQGTTFVLTFPC